MYITQANLNRLFDNISCNEIRLRELLHTNPLLKEMLSIPELEQLTAIEGVITGNTQLKILRNKGVKQYNNDRYVFKNNTKPCYHATDTCPRLESDYINYMIPEKIYNLGNDEVERYRQFFTPILADDDNDTRLKKMQININVVQIYYNSKGIQLDESEIYNMIKREHTPIIKINDKITLSEKIDEYRCFINNLKNDNRFKNVYNSRYINNQQIKHLFKNRSDEEKERIEQMQKFRKDILELSINKIMIIHEFNDNNLNPKILDELGFAPCQNCLKRQTFGRQINPFNRK